MAAPAPSAAPPKAPPFAPKAAVDPAFPFVDFAGKGHATFTGMHEANLALKAAKAVGG